MLNKTDLMALENDIAAIRHAGGVESYVKKRNKTDHLLIEKLERLLNELKKAEEDGKE